jgi:hypothetical protein
LSSQLAGNSNSNDALEVRLQLSSPNIMMHLEEDRA